MLKRLLLAAALLSPLASCGELVEEQDIRQAAHDSAAQYVKANGGDRWDEYSHFAEVGDFNSSGRTDVLLQLQKDSGLCTQKGCPLIAFENKGSKLEAISVIQNVYYHELQQEGGADEWPTLIVYSKDPAGEVVPRTVRVSNGAPAPKAELVKAYKLMYDEGYPEDATQGVPYEN